MNNCANTIVFATNNAHKLREMRQIMGKEWRVLSLDEIGCHADIAETADTLEGNALIKARYVKDHFGYDCFADDTGLFVDALNGAPGVYSARYAGEQHDAVANMHLILKNMDGIADRSARFRTVVALIEGDEVKFFEGVCEGNIATEPAGDNGFGYDPVFMPDNCQGKTFAQLSESEKNAISHRGRAMQKLVEYFHAKPSLHK